MWQLLIGAGIIALIAEAFSNNDSNVSIRERNKRNKIFISFAVEDINYRDFLVAQSKNENSPFDFVDMSVKEPWAHNIWKQKCTLKIPI